MAKTAGIDVKKVAKLGNLPISSDEERVYTGQLSKILDYVSQLNQVDTSEVEACFNVSERINILREDKVSVSLSQKEALANATKRKDGFFVTKGVFNEK